MNFSLINWLAVLVAALSGFLVGGIWYSKVLFAEAWMADSHLTSEQMKASSPGRTFGFTFFFLLIMAINVALFLTGSNVDLHKGIAVGFHFGLLTFCAIAIHSLFELKSWRHIFINGGYSIISLTLMGAILGLWR